MPKHPQNHLDPRQPLVVDTTKLPRQPGATRALQRVIPAPADLGLELISVPEGSDVELDLTLTSVSEGVYVSGNVRGSLFGECGRCLDEIVESFDVPLAELFAYADSTTEETTDADEVGRMQGDLLDLEPAVRDAVVLTLPANPVCRPDCPGLCSECGARLADLPADHRHEAVDPRWAALRNLSSSEE
ncbi:YceD family protein [Mangrovihabitans endophyticus]|uniref:Metal-binding protein n=1 Tax=Mangrovihabitans endophyticus TaxID=1751298 RepID=A0A8J3C3S0_9ACTN|nr:YceD family protein [Mangrovihabitans endophyticus]GGL10835.1 metal-binding protein [Mangrovihabitans endophyticus]